MKDYSIVIPLFNEAESLPELHDWIVRVMNANNTTYEIWFINDGSTDDSWKVIEELKLKDDNVKAVVLRIDSGGFFTFLTNASGEIVVTMDADLQDSPEEIPKLYNKIANEGVKWMEEKTV